MARAFLPGRRVAVAGRMTSAVEPGLTRNGSCSAVRRLYVCAETEAHYVSVYTIARIKLSMTSLR